MMIRFESVTKILRYLVKFTFHTDIYANFSFLQRFYAKVSVLNHFMQKQAFLTLKLALYCVSKRFTVDISVSNAYLTDLVLAFESVLVIFAFNLIKTANSSLTTLFPSSLKQLERFFLA